MSDKICCFVSNIQKIDVEEIKPILKKEIKNLIKKCKVAEFYVGAESNFDKVCIDCLQDLKVEFPNIKLNLVLSDFLTEFQTDKEFLQIFNEVIQLNFEAISPQFVRLSQFDWLIEKSNYLISYLENKTGKNPEIMVRNLEEKDLIFFPVRIKLMRLKRGISQAELAKAVEVSTSTIGMYEQGRRKPDFFMLIKICIELDIDSDYVLGLDKKFKPRTIEIDELLSRFIMEIRKNKKVIYNGDIMDKIAREKFAVSFATAFEVAKILVNKKCKYKTNHK